jgi:hypothetical protein
MAAHPPKVPPAQQSPHGTPDMPKAQRSDGGSTAKKTQDRQRHVEQQGRQGNTNQNLNHQGQQQDR